MTKPLVYIASPYSKGDPCANAHFQCRVWDELVTDGIVLPYAPLLSHFQHTVFPRPYKDWIKYDLEFIRAARFHALLRLTATVESMDGYSIYESSGADGEVELFHALKRPVFYQKTDLYRWVESGCPVWA